uniref:Alkyl transferase n=1 Tax=Schistocephalus solidus TaxID=70667 RepID=A0A0X3PTA0_SCHSO
MSWYDREYKYSFIQKFALNVLKQGVLPKHVAFIMDGNRRFAANRGLLKSEGHRYGFSKLTETITWCHDLGITEVSVYAFSIENFKRPESEVNFLMNLAAEKFQEFIDKNDELTERGVCVRVIGNLSLLPPVVRRLAAQVMLLTRHNTKATLNILLAYATRDELTHAAESIRLGVQEGVLLESPWIS